MMQLKMWWLFLEQWGHLGDLTAEDVNSDSVCLFLLSKPETLGVFLAYFKLQENEWVLRMWHGN